MSCIASALIIPVMTSLAVVVVGVLLVAAYYRARSVITGSDLPEPKFIYDDKGRTTQQMKVRVMRILE